jgi:hypothetical protein
MNVYPRAVSCSKVGIVFVENQGEFGAFAYHISDLSKSHHVLVTAPTSIYNFDIGAVDAIDFLRL